MTGKQLLELAENMARSYMAMVELGVPETIARDMSISAVQTHYAMEMQKSLADKVADTIKQQDKKPWED